MKFLNEKKGSPQQKASPFSFIRLKNKLALHTISFSSSSIAYLLAEFPCQIVQDQFLLKSLHKGIMVVAGGTSLAFNAL
jgi:hypothetical protein